MMSVAFCCLHTYSNEQLYCSSVDLLQLYNIHRVTENRDQWYFLHKFNELKNTVIIFVKQHLEDTADY